MNIYDFLLTFVLSLLLLNYPTCFVVSSVSREESVLSSLTTISAMKTLTESDLDSYRKNGYLLLPGIISPSELAELSKEYNELFSRKKQERGRLEALWGGDWKQETSNSSVLSIHNLQQHSAAFTRLLLHEALLDSLEDIMNNCLELEKASVVLHHTKAHLKPAKEGAPFPTHQDYHYFPYKHHSMMAVFVHLDDTDPSNGGLGVFPGSHLRGPQKDVSSSASHHYLDQTEWPMKDATPVTAKAGDVLVFSYLLVHGSYVNRSERERRMFLLQVAAGEDVPTSNIHRFESVLLTKGNVVLVFIMQTAIHNNTFPEM